MQKADMTFKYGSHRFAWKMSVSLSKLFCHMSHTKQLVLIRLKVNICVLLSF